MTYTRAEVEYIYTSLGHDPGQISRLCTRSTFMNNKFAGLRGGTERLSAGHRERLSHTYVNMPKSFAIYPGGGVGLDGTARCKSFESVLEKSRFVRRNFFFPKHLYFPLCISFFSKLFLKTNCTDAAPSMDIRTSTYI